jgi:thymidylate kinase
MSRIIVFEGPDRVGKATQSAMLKKYLEANGKKVALVEVPVQDGITYGIVYWMLKTGLVKHFPALFQCLQFLNRFLYQTLKLASLEHDNDYVIFDRWSLSTIIYGSASGLSDSLTHKLYRLIRCPDFTVVLLGQSHKHEAEDAYEKDAALQKRVSDLYAEWVNGRTHDAAVIDCSRDRNVIHDDIIRTLKTCRVIPV